MEKTRYIFKKIGDIKVIFHAKKVMIRDRKGKYLSEAEKIKKRCQECTEELSKKVSMTQIIMRVQ